MRLLGDIAVGEAKHLEAMGGEPAIAFGVMRLVVPRPIRLDDQLAAQADEIRNVRPEWGLAAKLQPVELTVAEQLPQHPLRRRRCAAEMACERHAWRAGGHSLSIATFSSSARPLIRLATRATFSREGRRGAVALPSLGGPRYACAGFQVGLAEG